MGKREISRNEGRLTDVSCRCHFSHREEQQQQRDDIARAGAVQAARRPMLHTISTSRAGPRCLIGGRASAAAAEHAANNTHAAYLGTSVVYEFTREALFVVSNTTSAYVTPGRVCRRLRMGTRFKDRARETDVLLTTRFFGRRELGKLLPLSVPFLLHLALS